MDAYVVATLVAIFVTVCMYFASVLFTKYKGLANVKNNQIIFSGFAAVDCYSDVKLFYVFYMSQVCIYAFKKYVEVTYNTKVLFVFCNLLSSGGKNIISILIKHLIRFVALFVYAHAFGVEHY